MAYNRALYAKLYRGAKKGIVLNGIEVEGLDKALRELGFKDAKKELAKHVKPPLRQVAKMMKARAPKAEDESDQSPSMRGKHIRTAHFPVVGKKFRGGRYVGWAIIAPRRKSLGIPDDSKWYYPTHIELGYVRKRKRRVKLGPVSFSLGKVRTVVPPRPFMRPVWDARKDWVAQSIAGSLAKWVDGVWRRKR